MQASWALAILILASLSSDLRAQSDIDKVDAYLRSAALFEASLISRLRRAECLGVSSAELASLKEHRHLRAFLRESDAAEDSILVWQSFSAGRSVQVAYVRGVSDELTEVAEATYWDGARCLGLDLIQRSARLFEDYQALNCFFVPREALGGYLGPHALVLWFSEARRTNSLRVAREDSRIVLSFPHPLTPETDRARLELGFAILDDGELRFESRSIVYANGLRSWTLRVGEWTKGDSVPRLPTLASLERKLASRQRPFSAYSEEDVRKMGSVRFEFQIEAVGPDGERVTSESLRKSLASLDEYRDARHHFVSRRGVDRRIESAAQSFFGRQEAAESAPRARVRELLMQAPGSKEWESLVPEVLAAEAEQAMDPIAIDRNFCGQAALALISRLQGKDLDFSALLREDPRECLTVSALLEMASKHALDLHAIDVDPGQLDWSRLRDACVFLIPGDEPGVLHAAVAQHRAGELLVWLSPSRAFRCRDARDWLQLKPTGVLLVTQRDKKATHGGVPFLWWALASLALGALLLGVWRWRSLRSDSRSLALRNPMALAAAVLLASVLAACQPDISEAPAVKAHVDSLRVPDALELQISAGSQSTLDLVLHNGTAREISVALRPISCSCVELTPETVVVEPRGTSSVQVLIREQGRGARRERLLLEGRSQTEGRREVEIVVHAMARLRVDPPGASVTMHPNSVVRDAFRIFAEGFAPVESGELLAAPLDARFRVQLDALPSEKRDEGRKFPPRRFSVTLAVADIEPGLHDLELSLHLPSLSPDSQLQATLGAGATLSMPVAILAGG